MNIIDEVNKLNLPLNKLLVFSSGTLQILGIRNAKDIDIAVTKDLYDELFKNTDWEKIELPWGGYNLRKGVVEIIPKLEWDKFPITTEVAIGRALIIDGVNFMSLYDVKEFKKAMGREKDLKDLDLIEQFENSKNKENKLLK